MHIKLIPENSREARLADKRLVLLRDPCCSAPNDSIDLIFQPGDSGEVKGFTLKESYGRDSMAFTATQKKVDEELAAFNPPKTPEEAAKWLDSIRQAESKIYQNWIDGEVYAIAVQEWDAAERMFKCVDSQFNIFGFEDVKECLKDMDLDGVAVFCVDTELGNPDDWRDKFREFDI